jgi:hypothetical protein
MDEAGRALLEEDLRSPCTEEIAVFRAFAREVGQGTGSLRRARYRAHRPHAAACSMPARLISVNSNVRPAARSPRKC